MWDSYALRWHAACPWGAGTTGCIIAPVENAAGEMTAIWRIKPVMEGKVERKGLGPIQGNFAPVVDHAGLEVLTVAEGVEDALSAWVLTTYPAWAALSAGNMAALRLPEQFRQIIICADHDPGGHGLTNARTLAGRLRAEGREARVILPVEGKDANDVLRGRAA
jgi:putative DNA primase/helicase